MPSTPSNVSVPNLSIIGILGASGANATGNPDEGGGCEAVKKRFLTLVAFTVLATSGAQAQQSRDIAIEKWRCFDIFDYSEEEVLVTLSRVTGDGQDREHGEVLVAGVTYRADFRVVGLDRRWNWGEETSLFQQSFAYSFIIRPNGDGLYYDFSDVEIGGETSPSQTFTCVSP